MRRSFSVIILFFILTSFSYSLEKMVIAVSPFENLSDNNSENYIGFQISEYMASALASIEDVTVIERGLLKKVLGEQNLQLSGMTDDGDAVELGNLLNAKQMLVGTYNIANNIISVKGRIVDVETARVTASANISGQFTGNINPVMQDFFYALLDKSPPEEVFSQMSVLEQRITKLESEKNESFTSEIEELQEKLAALESKGNSLEDVISSLKISLSVEAQLSMLKDMDQGASADNAKALEASFLSNDAEALKYLQSAIADPTKNYLSYRLSADSYYEKLSAIEGESFFVKMVKNQLEINKILSSDAEAISKYRNTLKLLVSRLYSVLHPDMFTLNVGQTEQIEMGTVSAIITLPSNISINVNDGTKKLLNRVLDTQDIIGNRSSSAYSQLVFKKAPPVLRKLLPNYGIKQLFPIGLKAGIGYSIQFVDKNDGVLFELIHDNLNPFNMATDSTTLWAQSSDNNYSVKSERDGWSFRGGKVEVQARELRNLHGVKVVIDRRSFNMDYTFPVYSDTKWKSVLLHAYRQKYIKIASDNLEDPMPQVKDLVVTHSVFSVGDYLEKVPLIVNPDYISGAADLTAVVYWGDSSSTVVTAQWSGLKSHTNENFIGALDSNSILYFSVPAIMDSGQEELTVSNNNQKKTMDFRTILAETWTNPAIRGWDLQVSGNRIYTSYDRYIACIDAITGNIIWKNSEISSRNISVTGNHIYISNGRYTASLDTDTGTIIWKNLEIYSDNLNVTDNRVYTSYVESYGRNSYTACLDAVTGKTLWKNLDITGRNLQVSGNQIYIACNSYTACLDADTGKTIWKNSEINGRDLQVSGNKIYISNERYTACLDANTGTTMWKNSDIDSSKIRVSGNRIFTHDPYNNNSRNRVIACLDADTGKTIWKKADEGADYNDMQISGNRLYTSSNYIDCLDADTGKTIWKNSEVSSDLQVYSNKIYTASPATSLDISTIEPWYQYKKVGDAFYSADNYSSAAVQYAMAYSEEGSRDGMIHYRYAYSKEQLEGLTSAVKNLYFQAWIRLKQQYPGHRYIASAEGKMD